MTTGHVRIPGAESLRIEFDRQCSTERRHDPLTLMDGSGRIISIRSGREWIDWSQELRVMGDEVKWKFNSDGTVNGWGWRFVVYPVMPASGPQNMQSDRSVLSRPSMDLVMWLLDYSLTLLLKPELHRDQHRQIGSRLAAALAACAQLSTLPAEQRMWSLQSLRKLVSPTNNFGFSLNISQMVMGSVGEGATSSSSLSEVLSPSPRPYSDTALSVLVKGLPEMLLRQYEYEYPIVMNGKHLLHSAFFKELVALACEVGLDALPCCAETYKWSWFRRYCMAARVATSLINRLVLPQVRPMKSFFFNPRLLNKFP